MQNAINDVRARDCMKDQKSLPVVPTMESCALPGGQPVNLTETNCFCRMGVPIQAMLTEDCSSNSPYIDKCKKRTGSPQWHRSRASPRARLCKQYTGHFSGVIRHH